MHASRVFEVLRVFTWLGLTSFGGPVAHLAYFRRDLVEGRQWLSESAYANLVAYCQFIPGPSSSQVGFLIGWHRAGLAGALAAFVGFTTPAALALAVLAIAWTAGGPGDAWLAGMKAAVLAVVAQAVLAMARSLCPDAARATIAAGVAIVCMMSSSPWMQVAALLPAGLAGLLLRQPRQADDIGLPPPSLAVSGCCLALLGLLIGSFVILASGQSSPLHQVAMTCFQAGGLVFGGGHVVLPLLRDPLVHSGAVSDAQFLAGYGLTQAMPGPLFTVSSWIGAVVAGWQGALIAVLAIFAPGLLLALGGLRFYRGLGGRPASRGLIAGLNAGVVGLLAAALWSPIGHEAAQHPLGVPLAVAAFIALEAWRLPAWAVVLGCAGITMLLP